MNHSRGIKMENLLKLNVNKDDEQTTTKPSNSIAKAKSEKPVVHKRNVVPRKPKVSITIEEFLALDAMLRKHNHGKNALNRREILDKIFTLVI